MKNKVKISACIITYNQEEFIGESLEGALKQKLNVPYEIIIGDDCSTDGTTTICETYQKRFTDLIVYKKRAKNLGMMGNWIKTIEDCSGEYIALCEGDDYWIDSYKLQKQVDFLEANPEYGMVCTDYHKYFQDNMTFKYNCFKIHRYKNEVSFEDYLFDRSTIGTASVVIRRNIYEKYKRDIPEQNRLNFNIVDTPLWLYISIKSKIKVMNEATMVYRILNNSASHFEDPYKHYEFVKKGLEVPKYFIEHYFSKKSVLKKFSRKIIHVDLAFAFKTGNEQMAQNAKLRLKKVKMYGFKERLLFFGSKNQINKYIVNYFFELYRYLKNTKTYVQK